jgi:hypothetical protein
MVDFSAGSAAFSGLRFIQRHPLTVLIWAVAYVLIAVVVFGLAGLAAWGPLVALGRSKTDFTAHPELLLAVVPSMLGGLVILAGLGLLALGLVYGAIYRALLRPAHAGIGYFRLGGDELRLLAVAVLFELLYLGVAFAGQVLGPALSRTGGGGMVLGGLVQIAGFLVWVYLAVRLSLAMPATFASRRIGFGESWRLTRGRFWKLLGTYLLTALVVLLAMIVLMIVLGVAFGMAGVTSLAAGEANLAAMVGMGLIAVLAYPLMGAALLVMMLAPTAEIYESLAGRTDTAEVFA